MTFVCLAAIAHAHVSTAHDTPVYGLRPDHDGALAYCKMYCTQMGTCRAFSLFRDDRNREWCTFRTDSDSDHTNGPLMEQIGTCTKNELGAVVMKDSWNTGGEGISPGVGSVDTRVEANKVVVLRDSQGRVAGCGPLSSLQQEDAASLAGQSFEKLPTTAPSVHTEHPPLYQSTFLTTYHEYNGTMNPRGWIVMLTSDTGSFYIRWFSKIDTYSDGEWEVRDGETCDAYTCTESSPSTHLLGDLEVLLYDPTHSAIDHVAWIVLGSMLGVGVGVLALVIWSRGGCGICGPTQASVSASVPYSMNEAETELEQMQ